MLYKINDIKSLLYNINNILREKRKELQYELYTTILVENSILSLLEQGKKIYYKYIKDKDDDIITNDLYTLLRKDYRDLLIQ